MRFGLLLGTHPRQDTNDFDTVLAVARAAEAAGFAGLWFADHFQFQHRPTLARGLRRVDAALSRLMPQHPLKTLLGAGEQWITQMRDSPATATPVLECFTTLAALAAATQRVTLGAFVAGVPYRNPALLAKMNTTLDVISHGRCIVGLGAAWHAEEFEAYGWRFPSVNERMERLEEAVQIIKVMMSNRQTSYAGQHYRITDAFNDPQPVQRPHPPILIGGSGERRTLRLVAQYADYCNVFGDAATVAHKFQVLRAHCQAVGRPFDAIMRSNFVSVLIGRDNATLAAKRKRYAPLLGHGIIGTPAQVIAELRAFAAAGVQYVVVNLPDAHTLEPIAAFAETVIPALGATR